MQLATVIVRGGLWHPWALRWGRGFSAVDYAIGLVCCCGFIPCGSISVSGRSVEYLHRTNRAVLLWAVTEGRRGRVTLSRTVTIRYAIVGPHSVVAIDRLFCVVADATSLSDVVEPGRGFNRLHFVALRRSAFGGPGTDACICGEQQ